MYVTFSVLKLERSKLVRLQHVWNISLISVTFNFQFSPTPSQSPTSKKSQKKFSSQPLLFRIFASNIANGDGFARPTTRLRNT